MELTEKEQLAREKVCLPLDGLNTIEEIKERVEKIDFYNKALPILRNKTFEKALEEAKPDTQRAKDSKSLLRTSFRTG